MLSNMHLSNQPPSISVSNFPPKKEISFGLLSFANPALTHSGTLCITSTPPPHPSHRMERTSFSAAFASLQVFVYSTLSLLNSSFFALRFPFSQSQKGPLSLLPRSSVGWRFGLGFRQLDQLLSFFFPYYILFAYHWQ